MKNLILIVGASGAGKDTLLKEARVHFKSLPRVHFVRRYITRMPGVSEDNFYVDDIAFELLKDNGFFISYWYAHDLKYGIPKSEFESLKNGETVIVSISRTKIGEFEQKFPGKVTTVNVTAGRSVIEIRLEKRKRENFGQIESRLQRLTIPVSAKNLINFDNNQEIELSSQSFNALLEEMITQR
ncbi:MAG: phosphonate metabolism protein/1,5-bisphosphokinase (PRPP-forming) PhnN [Nitrospiria bacterium]